MLFVSPLTLNELRSFSTCSVNEAFLKMFNLEGHTLKCRMDLGQST